MSPLWRDETGIYIGQRRVCLVRLSRGLRARLTREEDHIDPEASPGWEGALGLLERKLNEGHWSDCRVRLVVADQWARYGLVPWSSALTSAAERVAHARELMAGVFGDSMSDWTLTLSDAPPGMARLASAMPTKLLESLRELAVRHGQKLASVQPQLIAAYNTWCHVLPAAQTSWFVTVEAGSLAALRLAGRNIDRVHAVRIGLDWARELKRLQIFGRLANASPVDGRVYVDLPEALRMSHPALAADLEWLEETDPPLTTLHRLEHLRRRVA